MSVEKRIKDALLPFGDPVEKSFLYAAADDLLPGDTGHLLRLLPGG